LIKYSADGKTESANVGCQEEQENTADFDDFKQNQKYNQEGYLSE